MQTLLDSLPLSTTIHIRTKDPKHSITCGPRQYGIMEIDVVAKELVYFFRQTPIPGSSTKVSIGGVVTGGDGGGLKWVYLLMGEATSKDIEKDSRVVLDLASTLLGARGPCGELFSMERLETYHGKTLDSMAYDQGQEERFSGRIVLREKSKEVDEERLAEAVKERIRKVIVKEDTLCGYCGAPNPPSRCTRCRAAYFCNAEHQTNGWPYHKVYCKKFEVRS